MVQLSELPEHDTTSGGLTARYIIVSSDTIILRFDAVNADEAKRKRDAEYPGCEVGIIIYEGHQWR